MTPIWNARRLRDGESVYVKTTPMSLNGRVECRPKPDGLVLCGGILVSMGMDSEWDPIVNVRFDDPITNEKRHVIFSDNESEYFDCFYVER